MCTDGMVPMAMLVLAMDAGSPAALRQQITNHMACSAENKRTFDVHQRCVEAQRLIGGNAVVTYSTAREN